LSVSGVALTIPDGDRDISLDEFGKLLARLKKQAKASTERVVFSAV
jgi:hypothetical protein